MPPTTNSDSEDDPDYLPPAEDHESDSSDDHYERGTLEGSTPVDPLTDHAEQKKQRDALWASFQASVAAPPSAGNGDGNGQTSARSPEAKRVKIERTYLFAGKHVTEVVEVPEDSEEVTKWPRWPPQTPVTSDVALLSSENGKSKGAGEDEDKGDIPTAPPAAPSPAQPTTVTSTPGAKRPGFRKPRTALPSIPKASQAKKITTLDKSAMDWRAHVASQSGDVKNDLDANRRSGGYLEKMEFLKRVEDRREDALEASKASKRRKT